MSLDQFHESFSCCTKCPLSCTRNVVVPGSGNPDADIMFVGEAPGKKEDEGGKPFIGAAGKFLDEMLGDIGLNREDIFIANVVKCRPPKNRDPNKEEIAECLPYLKEQINIIKPKVIVTLGRFALNAFVPDAKIADAHGIIFDVEDYKILSLYHPAVALYNGAMRPVLKNDFQVLKKFL